MAMEVAVIVIVIVVKVASWLKLKSLLSPPCGSGIWPSGICVVLRNVQVGAICAVGGVWSLSDTGFHPHPPTPSSTMARFMMHMHIGTRHVARRTHVLTFVAKNLFADSDFHIPFHYPHPHPVPVGSGQ
jgi:hypothetical protein